jgi:hypothetical protein
MPRLRQVSSTALFLALATVAAVSFFPAFVNAIGFEKFDSYNSAGQASCLANMVQMTKLAFRNEGRADLADQVDKLFTTTDAGDTSPIGVIEVVRNIAIARVADLKRVKENPQARRIQVEDALLLTLKKNNIFTDTVAKDTLQLTSGFHNWTTAEYLNASEQDKKSLVEGYVKVALPAYLILDRVALKVAGQEDTFSADDIKDLLKIINKDFGSVTGTSHNATGIIGIEKKMREENAKKPGSFAFLAFLHFALDEQIAGLEQQDTALRQKVADMYDFHSIVLADGRHVLPDENGDFWVITRNVDDRAQIKLQGQDKIEAQRILACRQAGNSNCGAGNVGAISLDFGKMMLDAIAKVAAQNQQNNSPARPAAPTSVPTPAPQANAAPRAPAPAPAAPVDDPIGNGGFIAPPTTSAATAPALICVPPNLVSQTWGNPVKNSKMDYFQGVVGKYVLSVAQPGWQYWVLTAGYASYVPNQTADPSRLVRAVAPSGQPTVGTCPQGYSGYNVTARK